MPLGLQAKDIIGPAVAILAAALSVLCFWLNYRITKRMASRSLNLEAQKILLEIDRQLIADAWLWALYDDHPVHTDPEFIRKCAGSVYFRAKLEAFAYLKLNMFEVVLAEAPDPARNGKRNVSNVWLDYFRHTLERSSVFREILGRPDTAQLYNPVLLALWEEWRNTGEVTGTHAAVAGR